MHSPPACNSSSRLTLYERGAWHGGCFSGAPKGSIHAPHRRPCRFSRCPGPAVEVVKPRPVVPMWKSRIGLGVRGTGQVLDNGWNNLGVGGEFLYRASPHLVTELAAEYDHSTATALDRVDVPVTIGLRIHIGR